jgi:flavodoxin
MSYAVVYQSQSGSTRKVAQAIAEGLPGDIRPVSIEDRPALEGAQVVFVGLPIHGFGPAKEAAAFLQESCRGRRVAMFVTHASPEGAPMLEDWLAKCRDAAAGCDLVGFFDCQGELAETMRQAMLKMEDPNLRRWAETDKSQGQPDAARLDKARAFAREVAEAQGA